MIPIQGSTLKNQRPLTPSDAQHKITVVPKGRFAAASIKAALDALGISYEQSTGDSIKIPGTVSGLGQMLGTTSGITPGGHISYNGALNLPNDIHGHVLAVLGMDTHPVAKPHFRFRKRNGINPHSGLRPLMVHEVTDAYHFPNGATYNGTGQCIALIELGGGYQDADLNHFWKAAKFNPYPIVESVSVDGATNSPGSDADGEVVLDIEISGAVARASKIKVFFATNTDAGFFDAISQAANDPEVSIISISWGGPEPDWTGQAINAMEMAFEQAVAKGKANFVAAGDDGSTDGANDGTYNVDYPGSSPNVFCCGGTSLQVNGEQIILETVWNESHSGEGATGGGVSKLFSSRAVPDFSANADPNSGYTIFLDGAWEPIGGTSACAPLYAGLYAQLASAKGTPIGLNRAQIVANAATLFNDITVGNNSDTRGLPLYSAGAGKDNCTGYGSPKGNIFLKLALAE